jgi:hypothetical protein
VWYFLCVKQKRYGWGNQQKKLENKTKKVEKYLKENYWKRNVENM